MFRTVPWSHLNPLSLALQPYLGLSWSFVMRRAGEVGAQTSFELCENKRGALRRRGVRSEGLGSSWMNDEDMSVWTLFLGKMLSCP